jgi:hypothetical protein
VLKYCGVDTSCSQGDSEVCSGSTFPREVVFECAIGGDASEIGLEESGIDLGLSPFPEAISNDLRTILGATGTPVILDASPVPAGSVDNVGVDGPTVREYCIQGAVTRTPRTTPRPFEGQPVREDGTVQFGNCPAVDGCSPTPLPGCKGSVATGGKAGAVLFKTKEDKHVFKWKLGKGEAIDVSEFGDPLSKDPVKLCGYDGTSALIFDATIPAGGTCDGKDCWVAAKKNDGFTYADKSSSQLGINKIVLKSGADEKPRLTASGKGDDLPILSLPPYATPVRLQLQAAGGCWETIHSSSGTNQSTKFSAKAD